MRLGTAAHANACGTALLLSPGNERAKGEDETTAADDTRSFAPERHSRPLVASGESFAQYSRTSNR
jgi:hypothetical protein